MEQKQVQEQVQVLGESRFCQSCGMPMPSEEVLGTEQDGEKSTDYCVYCYEDGVFKQPDTSLQEMIDLCTGYLIQEGMNEAVARKLLADQLPYLKRWSTAASID